VDQRTVPHEMIGFITDVASTFLGCGLSIAFMAWLIKQ